MSISATGTSQSASPLPPGDDYRPLDECERGVIEVFVSAADLLGFPRSLGEIYGLAYISTQPVHLSEVCARLQMSKGSASQGLRTLRDLGALKPVYKPGDRREFFEPEVKIRVLLHRLLGERMRPHLEGSAGTVAKLKAQAQVAGDLSAEEQAFRAERVALLGAWQKRLSTVLPVVQRLLS